MNTFGDKQPFEEYYVAFDFTNVIGSALIVSAVVTVVDETGSDVTDTIVSTNDMVIVTPKVNVWVKGGDTGHTYKITCKITTDSTPAEKYELDAELPVIEI